MVMGNNGKLNYEVSQNAYVKFTIYSLRHKTMAVNGILVGPISPKDNRVVEISDSVPLFHSNLALLPPIEISLIMIDEHYMAQGLSIVGYFHANERFDDFELCGVAKNIGDHISGYYHHAPILLLYVKDASKNWRVGGADGGSKLLLKEPSTNLVLSDYISSEKWKNVTDVDDHLDDITKD